MGQKTYDVFISYSRKDYVDEHNNVIPDNEVSKIKEVLTQAGITFWFDEEGLYFGEKFTEKITDNIDASQIFLFLSTKNACESLWTSKEIACADELGKYIIPVRIDKTSYNKKVLFRIADLSYIDYGKNPEKGRQEIVNSIKAHLNEIKVAEEQRIEDEKRSQEELVRQRQKQKEERRRLKRISKIKAEIVALESQRTERNIVVLQKEQELNLAQVNLDACVAKIQKLQNKLQELGESMNKTEVEAKHLTEEKSKGREKRLQEEINAKELERVFTVGNASFKMIFVKGGRFHMGESKIDRETLDDEKPQHLIDLKDYFIGETMVTQALWKAVMGSNPSNWKGDCLPVESIAWDHSDENVSVRSFIKKLNKNAEVRKQLQYGTEFRLPKEAEWEYAARGGQDGNGYKYSGSDDIDEVAWYWENSGKKTHPVKSKKANELGLYDMSGNVWEWCEDEYELGPYRVLRGGGWGNSARRCRVSYRGSSHPSDRDVNIGFRLVLS